MIPAAVQPVRWTRRRWLTTMAVLLAAHFGVVLYFGERSHRLPRALRSKTSMYLSVDPWSARQLSEFPMAGDPALFALPSLNGFSGKAWLTFREMDYPLNNWTSPPAYLTLDVSRLATPSAADESNSLYSIPVAGRPLPDLVNAQLSVPPPPIATGSELFIEGDVVKRRLLEQVDVPSWAYADVLTNTLVQVLVDAEGQILSARLLVSSGLKAADDYALKRAATARFEPVANAGPSSCMFGRLVFHWHTTPPAETNSVSLNQ